MTLDLYPLGVALAIVAGCAINLGIVIQKKAVNEIPPEKRNAKFFRNLVVRRTWLIGLLVQIGIGTTCTIIAQGIIGPALLPGLLAVGLVPMAIGASKIVKESLKGPEIFAIGLIIIAAILLSLSNLVLPVLTKPGFNIMDPVLQTNEWEFTAVFLVIILITEIAQRKVQKGRSIALACQAGCLLVLANYWISPITVHIIHIFAGNLDIPWEFFTGIPGAVILILANITNIAVTQKAFRSGNASLVIPIQQVPVNIAPILVYFWVFISYANPQVQTIPFLLIAISLIVFSSFLLARRQSQLENIKIETSTESKEPNATASSARSAGAVSGLTEEEKAEKKRLMMKLEEDRGESSGYRVDSDENSNYMYDIIARIIKEAPQRAPCSENERKGSELMLQELKQSCDEANKDEFTCYPKAFLGWISLDACIILVSVGIFLLTTYHAWVFAIIALGLTIFAILCFVMQFLRYEEWTPKIFPYKLGHSQNVYGTLKPTGTVTKRVVFSGHIDSAYRADLIQYTKAGYVFFFEGGLVALLSFTVVYAVQVLFGILSVDASTVNLFATLFNWIAALECLIPVIFVLIAGRNEKVFFGAFRITNAATYILIIGNAVYVISMFILFYPFLFSSDAIPPFVRTICFLAVANVIVIIGLFFWVDKKAVPGVVDNLTAVAISMCIGKILAEWRQNNPEKLPKHTEVVITIVGCEEAGMRGSEAFAAKHAAEYNAIDTTCVNFESIADSSMVRIYTRENTTSTDLSPEVYDLLDKCATELGIKHALEAQPGVSGGTDAAGLIWGGLKASSLCGLKYQDYLAYQHTDYDGLELVNKERRPWTDNGTSWRNRNIRGAMEQALCIALRYLEKKDAE